jgi:hypothetical protein
VGLIHIPVAVHLQFGSGDNELKKTPSSPTVC